MQHGIKYHELVGNRIGRIECGIAGLHRLDGYFTLGAGEGNRVATDGGRPGYYFKSHWKSRCGCCLDIKRRVCGKMMWYQGERDSLVTRVECSVEIGCCTNHGKVHEISIPFTGSDFTIKLRNGGVVTSRHTLVELVIKLQVGLCPCQLIGHDILDLGLRESLIPHGDFIDAAAIHKVKPAKNTFPDAKCDSRTEKSSRRGLAAFQGSVHI